MGRRKLYYYFSIVKLTDQNGYYAIIMVELIVRGLGRRPVT